MNGKIMEMKIKVVYIYLKISSFLNKLKMVKIMSIDIGILNLGFVYANVTFPEVEKTSKYKNKILNEKYTPFTKNIQVIGCNRIDITKIKHNTIKQCDCKLHHERCIPDYLDHFIQEYSDYFEDCDLLLLERQPPVGITNVQDLLFTRFRDKVLLISPNSVHKYFELGSDYNTRKIYSEKIAEEYLIDFKSFTTNFRKHDISDALLILIYYFKIKVDEMIEQTNYIKYADLEQFRFTFFTNNELLKN
jgi:hypothetical protein